MSIKADGIESYKGKVVAVSGHDERIMSDVWEWMYDVAVIDGGTYKTVSYLCSTTGLDIEIDASPAQIEAYKNFIAAKRYAEELKASKIAAYNYAAEITRGKTVEIFKGRAAKAGTRGLVFWIGKTAFGDKIGIAIDDTRDANGRYANVVWTYKANVKVVIPQNVLDEIEAMR